MPWFLLPGQNHCGVILAASARMRAMRSWLMRKTNRRLAIWAGEKDSSVQRWQRTSMD